MISISVNHESKSIEETAFLNQLLEQLQISTNGIAVAVNNQIITKTSWDSTQLQANDAITIIQATQGG